MSRTAWSKACENPIAAINFALDELNDDWDRYLFLKDWREGTVEDWPEFFFFCESSAGCGVSVRAYTVSDLDALRRAVETKWLYGTYNFPKGDCFFSRSYKEEEKTKSVEALVRTHMLAGHTADDLVASESTPS